MSQLGISFSANPVEQNIMDYVQVSQAPSGNRFEFSTKWACPVVSVSFPDSSGLYDIPETIGPFSWIMLGW